MKHFAQLILQTNDGKTAESVEYEVSDVQVESLQMIVSKLSKTFDIALLLQISKDNSVFTSSNNSRETPTVLVASEAPVVPEQQMGALVEVPEDVLQRAHESAKELIAEEEKKK